MQKSRQSRFGDDPSTLYKNVSPLLKKQNTLNEAIKKYYSDKILQDACERYQLDYNNAALLRGNLNLVYECDGKILRLSHSSIRPVEEILVELDWVNFLYDRGLPVARVLPSRNKWFTERVGDSKDYFTVVCFEKILGGRVTKEEWTEHHFQKLGTLTGQLHRIGGAYKNKPNFHYPNWEEIPEFESYKHAPKDNRNLIALHDQLVNEFRTYSKSPMLYGLIHYDIHHGNYLLTGNSKIVLFDFEMTCYSWYINDVATVLYYAGHFPTKENTDVFESRFLKHFWAGYNQEFQLPDSEKEKISKFLLYRDLMLCGHLELIWKGRKETEFEISYKQRIATSIQRRRTALGI